MPIYAYRCSNCGHAQDALQKMSDPVLTVCPACGEPTYVKQVTAAGFQLKGSGWYVTDFRGDGKGGKAAEGDAAKAGGKDADQGGDKPAEAKSGDSASKSEGKNGEGSKPAESAPAAAPAPAPAASSPAPAAAAPPAKPSGKTSG
jgi:putative FmdB family regulatory protein